MEDITVRMEQMSLEEDKIQEHVEYEFPYASTKLKQLYSHTTGMCINTHTNYQTMFNDLHGTNWGVIGRTKKKKKLNKFQFLN